MTPLVKALWDLEAKQAEWTVEEFNARDHGKARLRRYLHEILVQFDLHILKIRRAYVAIAGIECGWFQPVASLRRPIESIIRTPTNGHESAISKYLNQGHCVLIVNDPGKDLHYKGEPDVKRRCVLKLIADHDCFGFVVLDSLDPVAFEAERETLHKATRVLSRTVADAVFSMRLRILGAPMHMPEGPPSQKGLQAICLELASRTAYGFGADGAVLRLYDAPKDILEITAHEGDVPADQLIPRKPNEGIAGKVFNAETNAWALGSMPSDSNEEIRGLDIPREDHDRLLASGIHAFLIMKLSCYSPKGSVVGLGTLAFFHRRAHRFSWHEISLYQSHCQNVADTISLYQTNIALEEAAENLRIQNLTLTRVEVMALLAHDFGHKALEAGKVVDDYINACRKTLNNSQEKRTHAHLEDKAGRALQATQQIGAAIQQFRQLYQREAGYAGDIAEFDLRDVIGNVELTLAGALHRNRIAVEPQYTGSMKLRGHKEVLIQVFFNLFINSIEAIRSSGRVKPSSISIHAHEEKTANPRRILVQFWDEGPGINRQVFPIAKEIFSIGKTSKPGGTGTGLPVARRMLSQYFHGDISLVSAEDARFRIVLPDTPER